MGMGTVGCASVHLVSSVHFLKGTGTAECAFGHLGCLYFHWLQNVQMMTKTLRILPTILLLVVVEWLLGSSWTHEVDCSMGLLDKAVECIQLEKKMQVFTNDFRIKQI
jgi:hypothetical protein